MKNGYRAAPILVALLVLFVSVLGLRTVSATHGSDLGTVEFKTEAAIDALRDDPTTSTTDVDWVTTDSTTNSVNTVAIVLHDENLAASGFVTTTVKSDTNSLGFSLGLVEVGGNTGIFTGTLILATSTSSTNRQLAADHDDTVTVEYLDANTPFGALTIAETLTVDTEGPDIDEVTPEDGTIAAKVAEYTAEVVDEDSGLNNASINFLINTEVDDVTDPFTRPAPLFFRSLADLTDADDAVIGQIITMTVPLTGPVWVTVRARDIAGNETIFDANRLTAGVTDMVGITIDAASPVYEESFTGVGWDNIAKALTFNNAGSIIVIFSDNLTNLDPDSVVAGDFAVQGNTVTRADVFDHDNVTSATAVEDLVDEVTAVNIRRAVFLTLGSDLAPDEEPEVALVGDRVNDEAGNTAVTNSEDAQDRIAPTITIGTVSPELVGDGDRVTITITSDEALDGDDLTVTITNAQDGGNLAATVDYDGGNSWTVSTAAISTGGAYSIHASGEDLGAENFGDAGTTLVDATFPIAGTALDDHTVFEGDVELPAPRVTPADADTPDTRDPFFIIIDFSETTSADNLRDEGSEYEADDHATVTLTVLTWDGVNILGDQDTKDDITFVVAVNEIALGDHTLVVNAEDEAGNTLGEDLSVTFTVEERAAFSISLDPGWNLVSFPGDPADGDIDVVMADVTNVTAVVTYDPALPGGFLSAIREEGGSFAGTLTSIESSRGYWINTITFETLDVDIPSLAAGQVGLLPPSLPISEGWNLVPVLDVVGAGAVGNIINAGTYFGSVADIAAVYTYDTITNTWQFVDSSSITTDNVELGRAYWVYTTAAGVLVPSGVPVAP